MPGRPKSLEAASPCDATGRGWCETKEGKEKEVTLSGHACPMSISAPWQRATSPVSTLPNKEERGNKWSRLARKSMYSVGMRDLYGVARFLHQSFRKWQIGR